MCRAGFSGYACQLNPCSINPCRNNGVCTLSGTNQYKCTCQVGYTGTDCESVYDPCFINSSPACLNNGVCTVNLRIYPYYTCACQTGYTGTRCQNSNYKNNPSNCVDKDSIICQIYSSNKYCSSSYYINGMNVLKYCPKSCNTCTQSNTITPSCVDTNLGCTSWASLNYCKLYPVYNLCKKSCNLC